MGNTEDVRGRERVIRCCKRVVGVSCLVSRKKKSQYRECVSPAA